MVPENSQTPDDSTQASSTGALPASQSPDKPNSEVSIDDLPELISKAVDRAYRIYGHRPDRDNMEDLAQSIALSLIKNDSHSLHSFEGRSSLETWLQKVANSHAVRFFRGQKDKVSLEDMTPDDFPSQQRQEDEVFFSEMKKYVDKVAGKLTKGQRKLLELIRQDLDDEEIGERMGIEPDSVSRNIRRLRDKISKLLKSKGWM